MTAKIEYAEPGSLCEKVWVTPREGNPVGWCWSIGGGAGPHVCDRAPGHAGRCRCGTCDRTTTRAVVST